MVWNVFRAVNRLVLHLSERTSSLCSVGLPYAVGLAVLVPVSTLLVSWRVVIVLLTVFRIWLWEVPRTMSRVVALLSMTLYLKTYTTGGGLSLSVSICPLVQGGTHRFRPAVLCDAVKTLRTAWTALGLLSKPRVTYRWPIVLRLVPWL